MSRVTVAPREIVMMIAEVISIAPTINPVIAIVRAARMRRSWRETLCLTRDCR
jgi:hypothetical protein